MHMFYALQSYGDFSLLVLRLAIAAIFFAHGPKKLNGSMGSFMTVIGWIETVGGISVLLGLLTQLGALGLGIIMLGATWKKINEWHVPFTAMDKMGWEFDLIIFAACFVLFVMGAGYYSVDALWLNV